MDAWEALIPASLFQPKSAKMVISHTKTSQQVMLKIVTVILL